MRRDGISTPRSYGPMWLADMDTPVLALIAVVAYLLLRSFSSPNRPQVRHGRLPLGGRRSPCRLWPSHVGTSLSGSPSCPFPAGRQPAVRLHANGAGVSRGLRGDHGRPVLHYRLRQHLLTSGTASGAARTKRGLRFSCSPGAWAPRSGCTWWCWSSTRPCCRKLQAQKIGSGSARSLLACSASFGPTHEKAASQRWCGRTRYKRPVCCSPPRSPWSWSVGSST